jgi:membrane protease YdiL (CAAX protease family)
VIPAGDINMRLSRFPVAWFFVLVFVLQAVVMFANRFAPARVGHILWPYLANPSVAGLLMILWLQGLPGIRRVLHQLTPWAMGRAWPMLIVCLILPLAGMLLTVALLAARGFHARSATTSDLLNYLYNAFIDKGFLGSGLIEEIGWRGFALPYLQRRHSALVSSLIIGLVWGLWHVPFFAAQRPFPWEYLALFIPSVIVYSVIFTSFYNITGGSIVAIILLHGSLNAGGHLRLWHALPDTAATQLSFDLPFLLVAVALLWLYGPANLARSKYVSVESPRGSGVT